MKTERFRRSDIERKLQNGDPTKLLGRSRFSRVMRQYSEEHINHLMHYY
jgi:hypothetical protein